MSAVVGRIWDIIHRNTPLKETETGHISMLIHDSLNPQNESGLWYDRSLWYEQSVSISWTCAFDFGRYSPGELLLVPTTNNRCQSNLDKQVTTSLKLYENAFNQKCNSPIQLRQQVVKTCYENTPTQLFHFNHIKLDHIHLASLVVFS